MNRPESALENVENAWKEHWDKSDMRPDLSFRGRLLRSYVSYCGGFSSSRHTLKTVLKHLGSPVGKTVLDAGSGTGMNSLLLSRLGAEVTLLDIAPQALEIAKTFYREQGLQARFLVGSIFEIPSPDGTFDVVWNTGVIEHFEPEARKSAIREMLRVMRPDGVLITLNPNANARVYRFAKARAEKTGTWDVGVEIPIETLAADIDHMTYVLREYEEGWFMQFHFLKYLVPRFLRLPFVIGHEVLQNFLNFTNRWPGYLRVSVIRRLTSPTTANNGTR